MEKLYGIADIDIGGNNIQTNVFDFKSACANSFLSQSTHPGVHDSYCFMQDGNICFGYRNNESKTILVLNLQSMQPIGGNSNFAFNCSVYMLDGQSVELDQETKLPVNCPNIEMPIHLNLELFLMSKESYSEAMCQIAEHAKIQFSKMQAQQLVDVQKQRENKAPITGDIDREFIEVNQQLLKLSNEFGLIQSRISNLLVNGMPEVGTKYYSALEIACGRQVELYNQIVILFARRNELIRKYVQNVLDEQNMQNTASSYGGK